MVAHEASSLGVGGQQRQGESPAALEAKDIRKDERALQKAQKDAKKLRSTEAQDSQGAKDAQIVADAAKKQEKQAAVTNPFTGSQKAATGTDTREDEHALQQAEADATKLQNARIAAEVDAAKEQENQAGSTDPFTGGGSANTDNIDSEVIDSAEKQAQQDKSSEDAAVLQYKGEVKDEREDEKRMQDQEAKLQHMSGGMPLQFFLWAGAVAWAATILVPLLLARYTSMRSNPLQARLLKDADEPNDRALGA